MSVLVAGCGYVGGALAARLAARGEKVFGLVRSPREIEGVEIVVADVRDPATLRALPEGIDRVVYAAAPDGPAIDAYRAVYVDGLRTLLAALRERGPVARCVVTTSTAVYAQEDGSWVDERSAASALGTPELLREAETIVRGESERGIGVRLAGIYGPGRDRLVRAVAEGTARRPRTPRYTNRIHRDDCASAIDHVLSLAEPAPVYVGVDDEPANLADVYAWIGASLGVEVAVESDVASDGGARGRGGNKRCRNALLRASGWQPTYPTFREGYRAAIDARREAK